MRRSISFTKMHGLGNDFVMADGSGWSEEFAQLLAVRICDRRLGIGCDQFIVYSYQDHQNRDYQNQGHQNQGHQNKKPNQVGQATMSIYNPDGNQAKACGNASRCLARLIFDRYGVKDIDITVKSKKIKCQYTGPNEILVNMGVPGFNAEWMPPEQDLWEMAQKFRIEPKEVLAVDVGNPHLVVFARLSAQDQKIIGKNLQAHELFPDGVNVNFASVNHSTINLKVWERGTGFTNACGSGACASFAAANKLGFVDNAADVAFELGSLKMSRQDGEIVMNGPAAYVFSGEYYHEQ